MSEVVSKLQRMLVRAQQFVEEAPLEAVARMKLVLKEATAERARASGADRASLEALCAIAAARLESYEERFASWNADLEARSKCFVAREQEHLQQPIPPKV